MAGAGPRWRDVIGGDGRSGVMAPGLGHDSEAEAARVWEQEGARQESRTAWSEG